MKTALKPADVKTAIDALKIAQSVCLDSANDADDRRALTLAAYFRDAASTFYTLRKRLESI